MDYPLREHNIVTPSQAQKFLLSKEIVDLESNTVEGEDLLTLCGYNFHPNAKMYFDRMIHRHKMIRGLDYFVSKKLSEKGALKNEYRFSSIAASKIVLVAAAPPRERKPRVPRKPKPQPKPVVVEASIPDEQLLASALIRANVIIETKAHKIKKVEEAIIDLATPVALTKLIGGANVSNAYAWLHDNSYLNYVLSGYRVTPKGASTGCMVQVSTLQVKFTSKILDILPSSEFLKNYESLPF